jgi:hypothetical protein
MKGGAIMRGACHSFHRHRPVATAVLLVLLTGTLSGCGQGKRGNEVSGTVKLNGTPVTGGKIIFINQDNPRERTTAVINSDGRYILPQLAEGEYKVAIESSRPSGPADQQARAALPQRYQDPNHSGLTYKATKGKQTKDFELTS